jgi:hypothetical protein
VSVAPGDAGGWGDAGDGAFFEGHVGVEVDLGRFDVFVSEPECDHGAIDAGVWSSRIAAVSRSTWAEIDLS